MGGTISTDMTIMRQINCKEADELSEALGQGESSADGVKVP